MNVEFNIFGTKYSFNMKIESEEDVKKIVQIINEVCDWIEKRYKNLARDKKIALLVLFLAHKVLQKEKRIERLNQLLKDYETALTFVEKMDES
ncbi:MAG: cell division protein ZapA [Candidatus Hydrothermia bacterium]|jgi:cell division protein ZapA (FtsZ GTPase activity inhibitor)|nr:cell division protein ZapA [Candidatus Hydrothermia bacterium]